MQKIVLFFYFLSTYYAQAAYYETLPKGVRTFVYKRVQTGSINGTFDSTGNFQSMDRDFKINTDLLGDDETTQGIKEIDPYAYDSLSVGEYSLNADANINVNAFALGWGLTDRLSVYGFIPYFDAKVQMTFFRNKENNYKEVADHLAANASCSTCQGVAEVIRNNIPDFGAEELQGIVTGEFGYEPLGNWHGQGFGDSELGLMYNFLKMKRWGSMIKTGFIIPTGREDDPNIIQDISFGDGQWDIFAETGFGIEVLPNLLTFNLHSRYTHQIEAEKQLRVPLSSGIPFSNQIGLFKEKLGDKISVSASSDFRINKTFNFMPSLQYEKQAARRYESEFTQANQYLSENSSSNKWVFKTQLTFSTVKLFQEKKFILPGQIVLGYENTFAGRNTTKVQQVELDLRLFF